MASSSGIEEMRQASDIIKTVCNAHGCVYAQRCTDSEVGEEDGVEFDCRIKYEEHVIEDFSGDGCQKAAIAGPSSDSVIPGVMTTEGFTRNTEKPETHVGHFDRVYGSHFTL